MRASYRRVIAAVLALVMLAAAAGYLIGSQHSVRMSTGIASPAEGAISLEADGWTYNVPLDVPWTDQSGVFHDGDRPACLAPTITANVSVSFAWVDVAVGGSGWRQVVWVGCQAGLELLAS